MEELQPRMHELEPHADRQNAANQAAYQREHEIHRADVFVIGRIKIAPPPVRLIVALHVRVRHRLHKRSPCVALSVSAVSHHHRLLDCAAATTVCGSGSRAAYFFFASSIQAAKACSLTTRTAIGMNA